MKVLAGVLVNVLAWIATEMTVRVCSASDFAGHRLARRPHKTAVDVIRSLIASLVFGLIYFVGSERRLIAAEELVAQRRYPVAVTTIDGGRNLIVANRRSGTVSLVDPLPGRVVREVTVGELLSDLTATSDPERFLVTDEQAGQLIAVRVNGDDCKVEKRLAVSLYPVTVRVSADGHYAFVASLWTKTLTVVDLGRWLSSGDSLSDVIMRQIPLPFAPREQVVVEVNDQKKIDPIPNRMGLRLVVADAFGSKVAVIDPEGGQILSVREIAGHAIRCLRLHPEKPSLVMTHQMMGRDSSTTEDAIHWGALMRNCLQTIGLKEMLDPGIDLSMRNSLDYIGGPDHGAGDPAGFTIMPNGAIAVALAGTDELLIDQKHSLMFTNRVKTGSRPVAVAAANDHSQLFVVNSLDDSIMIVERGGLNVRTVSLGPRPELTEADRGERLFHSAKLSHDQWISCASCHVDGHSNGLLSDNSTDGTYRSPKRILSLRGVAETAPYAWSGRFTTLNDQVANSMVSTMQGEPPTEVQAKELVAFLGTLPPIPTIVPKDSAAVARGQKLFDSFNCRQCHSGSKYTSPQVVDVGIHDESGASEFNPPSLRGVQFNGPYFHDGRAKDLESIFSQFRHQLPRDISAEERSSLVAFLKSL